MKKNLLRWMVVFWMAAAPASLGAQDRGQEERDAAKYYDKWLNEDVVYIITDEERDVFSQLTTSEEKDRFIEQFWRRRDSDLSTALNEYKEEHYRRIAYVNQKFGSGIPGWKTDRGRTYIMFGEPAQVEYNAGGGTYVRNAYEGGGRTATYPFEIWRYRHLDGIGDDIEIEFVDRSWSGEFKVAIWPWEKDMLLHVDGLGETTAERLGIAKRYERPGLHPGHLNNTTWMKTNLGARSQDRPFERVMRFFQLQRPPQIKNKELQQLVETKLSFNNLPFITMIHHVWIDSDNALTPLTVEVPNSELRYEEVGDVSRARVAFYGRVTSMLGEVAAEFEETVTSQYPTVHIEAGKTQRSLYQKTFLLGPGRYKIDIVVKDLNSGDIGTRTETVYLRPNESEQLSVGAIVLAKQLEPLETFPEEPETFVLGDVRVVPNVQRRFKTTDPLGVYLQVYNTKWDSSSSQPSVSIHYTITNGDKVVAVIKDDEGASIEYASHDRLVLVRRFGLEGLEKGHYRLTVQVNDTISGQSSQSETDFEVLG